MLLVALVSVPVSVSASGIGISPVELRFEEALRGGTYSRTLTLRNTDPDHSARFEVAPEGGVAGWVDLTDPDGWSSTAADGYEILVAPSSVVQVAVTVRIPDTAPNGAYEGALEVLGSTVVDVDDVVDDGSTGAGVQLAGLVPIRIEVTGTQVYDARAADFVVDPAEVGMHQRLNAMIVNDGNVQVEPEVAVRILRDGDLVEELSSAGAGFPVGPSTTGRAFVEWDTTEHRAGDYLAEFEVVDVAGGMMADLGARTVAFRLEPLGTFTRSATLDGLVLREDPEPGGLAVFTSTFTNTGRIDTTGVIEGELYRDGELVDRPTSLGRAARPRETVAMDTSVRVAEPGQYRFVAALNYDGHVTDPLEVTFEVSAATSDPLDADPGGGVPLRAGVLVVSSVLAGLALFWRRRMLAGKGS